MASTDTTALTELVNSEFINDGILAYAHEAAVSAAYLNWLDLRGKGTKSGSFPKWVKDAVTKPTNENTDLGSELLELTSVEITATELGVRRDVTDAGIEETIIGAQLFDFIVEDAGMLMGVSLEADICALHSGVSSSVGTTTANLTLANMVEAQATIRSNGQRGQLINIISTQQAFDYQNAQLAATSTMVAGFTSVEHGVEDAYLGTFMGAGVYATALCPTANAAADDVGACYVRGDTNPKNSAFGGVITRAIRVEEQRDASMRLTEVVATAKWGVGEISDLSAVKIVTDAA